MTPDHFRLACVTLWGPRWQGDAAVVLDVGTRSIRAWLAGESPVPDGVKRELLDRLLDKSMACLNARLLILGDFHEAISSPTIENASVDNVIVVGLKAIAPLEEFEEWENLAPVVRQSMERFVARPDFDARAMYYMMHGYFIDGPPGEDDNPPNGMREA